ncbi:transcription factor TFIID complex subunit Taf3 [Schizosaccharomyces osmophilus]|uniref:Transcription factor TFIID complex subunit Taf3 n=1 Tax=Schizosaccharomyces osmophilus TaxID=2545709 RepID=A0AAE9WDA0_9SCHI|nr:transcription factor TFIID complex subunit Taf3 [Schizosaccharomyces osmophilus]WBW73449.1 transcription factor TFIID complex subunit Taf3 [Schizosaccharomyces osmophilus]
MEGSPKNDIYFCLMRVFCSQTLRAAGLDRTKLSLLDSFTDVMIRYIQLLSETTMTEAELSRKKDCDLQDFRLALEEVGLLDGTEEDVKEFIEWYHGPQMDELRRVAGFQPAAETQTKPKDWLTNLVQKQVRVSGPERFQDTMFSSAVQNNPSHPT